MASQDVPTTAKAAAAAVKSTSVLEKLDAWGSSALAPMGLATLVAALHTRPIQPFPLLFAPALIFASYVNMAGYAVDAAGMTAAWSGLYVLLSLRRRRLTSVSGLVGAGLGAAARSWTPAALRTSSRRMQTPARRAVSAVAMGLGTVNCVAGGVTYAVTGDRAKEAAAREERNRWGQ